MVFLGEVTALAHEVDATMASHGRVEYLKLRSFYINQC